MRVGFDLNGGDYPQNNLIALLDVQKGLAGHVQLVLFGSPDGVSIDIAMDFFECIVTENSIETGIEYLRDGKIDSFISTGETGEVIKEATIKLGNGERLCLPALLPNEQNNPLLLLDIGANIGCSPNTLKRFGILGSEYMKESFNIDAPRVGLLNVGTEDTKGTPQLKRTFKLLSEQDNINFIGNVEGFNLYDNSCDVIVCDGLVGNILIKQFEALTGIVNMPFADTECYGGAQLLGIKEKVIIGHGSASDIAIQSMILNLIE